jgi:2-polyprenyl-6-hydroxyphenyl methylase/3-demethylubiquinone-9 3-methyltransferase
MTSLPASYATTNADQAELAKFSALAARWWDPAGEFKPLHCINPLRLDWIRQIAGELAHQQIVDVGCGGGILAESMAKDKAQVLGIDLAEPALKVARLHSLETGVPVAYRTVAVEQLAYEQPNHYDIVSCMELLEHVPDPSSTVQACADLVKPDGWVFFSTLNRNVKSFFYAIVGAEYLLKLLPAGTHNYENFIKPSELAAMLRPAGLTLMHVAGITYHPLTRLYTLSADTSVNYLMAARKLTTRPCGH